MSSKPANTLAAVLRGYWQDYETNGLPLFDQLVAETTYDNPELVKQEVDKGLARASSAIDVAGRNQAEQLRGFGIEMSAEQQADNQRLQGLSRSTALTDAANRITQNLIDRNRAIATGGSMNSVYRQLAQSGQAGR